MAGKTYYLIDASLSSNGTLSETSAAAANTGTGWVVGTATANSFSTMLYATIRARTTLTTGLNPLTTSAAPTTGQAWRSESRIHGTFSSATAWQMDLRFRTSVTPRSQQGRIMARIWKSANTLATSASELTIGTAAGFLTFSTTGAVTTASNVTSSFTWSPGTLTFDNEYLFIQPEWCTVIVGTNTAANVVFRSTDSTIVAPNYTATTTAATGSESFAPSDSAIASKLYKSTGAESFTAADSQNASRKLTPLFVAESATVSDSQSAKTNFTPLFVSESVAIADSQDGTAAVPAVPQLVVRNYAFSPTQLFMRFGFKPVAGLNIATAAETLSLTDSQSARITTLALAAETIALTDSQVAKRTTTSAVTETLLFADTQTKALLTKTTVAETIILADTQAGKRTTKATAAETIALADSQSTKFTTRATASETIALADSQSTKLTTRVTVPESITLTDSASATTVTPGKSTTDESITLTDSQSALRTTKATATESILLADSQTGLRTTRATATESITLADAQTRLRTTRATAAETISLADAQATKQRSTGALAETVLLSDSQTARQTSSATVSETITLTDITNGTVITAGMALCPESFGPLDQCDATVISGARIDRHDGVRKKKKKKQLDFTEEVSRRERIRKQIEEVIHPPIPEVLPILPEEKPQEKEPEKAREFKPIAPAIDYAGLARDEIVARIKQEAQIKAWKQQETQNEINRQLELKRLADEQDERDVEELILKEFT